VTTYAILGSGHIGGALASQFARKGIEVLIANKRGPDSVADLARELGSSVKPVALREALRADVVILAVPFPAVREAVENAEGWNGRIVVDATNAIGGQASQLQGRLSTEVVADAVPGARVVKAFNTLFAAVLALDPAAGGGQRVVLVSGNDEQANTEIAHLVERLGFAPVVLGRLADGGRLQHFGAPLVGLNLIKLGNPPR
jgi:8-hydroxy-5-deazaflavin:NADPH oxidoreductase